MKNRLDYPHFINLLDYMRLKTPEEQTIALSSETVRTMAQLALEEIIPEPEPSIGFIEAMRRSREAARAEERPPS